MFFSFLSVASESHRFIFLPPQSQGDESGSVSFGQISSLSEPQPQHTMESELPTAPYSL